MVKLVASTDREVHLIQYVPDFGIVDASGCNMASHGQCPPVYHPRLLTSSISMLTATFIRAVCIFHALVKRTSSSYVTVGRSKKFGHNEDINSKGS